jgi:hypothetical protein
MEPHCPPENKHAPGATLSHQVALPLLIKHWVLLQGSQVWLCRCHLADVQQARACTQDTARRVSDKPGMTAKQPATPGELS